MLSHDEPEPPRRVGRSIVQFLLLSMVAVAMLGALLALALYLLGLGAFLVWTDSWSD